MLFCVKGKTHCCSDAGVLNFMRQGSSDNLNYGENASTGNKKTAIFSPVVARHVHQLMSSSKVTLRDIRAGEEIVRSDGHSI